jgi:PAS domain-containing protein
MNGLGLPKPQPSIAQLRDELALAEACHPIEQEAAEAKQAYRDALSSGDPDEIAAAKARKQAAADRINETRTWLRAEARIAYLTGYLERPVSDTRPDVELRHAMQQELDKLEQLVAPFREAVAAFPPGPVVVVEDGTVEAVTPAVQVQAHAMKGGK